MAYTTVAVTGSFPGQTGQVTFTPPQAVTDTTGTIPALGPAAFTYTLSGGTFTTAPLLCTDNPGLLPAAWCWEVTVALTGQRAYTYPVLLPTTPGGTTTLASLPISAAGSKTFGALTAAIAPATVTLTDATSIALNAAAGNYFRVTLGGAPRTLANPTSPTDGQFIVIEIIQDATGGRTLAWDTQYFFPTSISVALSAAGGSRDVIAFRYDASISTWACNGFVPATGSSTVSGQFLCTPTVYAPGTQTALAASTTTMAAFSSANLNTGAFTAPASGSVVVSANFAGQFSAAAGAAIGLAAHGTVTPIVGNEFAINDSAANITRTYQAAFLVTGLTAGTSYNLDLVGCATSGQSFSILAQAVTSTTPTVATHGGPATMTVQAV